MNSLNVVSGFSPEPRYDFSVYAKGYLESAKILLENLKTQSHYNDNMGYPIIFLYRHTLELFLKGIIYQGALLASYENLELIDDNLNNPKKNKTHDLISISKKSTAILSEIFSTDSDILDLCEKIKKNSIQLDAIDKGSYSYRYPIDNLGNTSTIKNQTVDLVKLGIELDELFEELDTLSFGLQFKTQELYNIIDSLAKD